MNFGSSEGYMEYSHLCMLPALDWEVQEDGGECLGRSGLGEERDLSKVQCHRVHPATQLFSPGELILVIWSSVVKVGDL